MKNIITRTRAQVYKMWLAALRSGEYRRGKSQLRITKELAKGGESYTYCCLGVLQDQAVKDGGDPWFHDTGAWNENIPANVIPDSDATPSHKICQFLGLTDEMLNKLIDMNDDEERSFREIADHIEKNILPEVL